MSIEINEDTIGIWIVDMPDMKYNWMCAASAGKDEYLIICRFRHEVDDEVWHSKDKKTWFEVRKPINEISREGIIEICRTLAEKFWKIGGGSRYEILADDRGPDGIMNEMLKLPMIHSKKMTDKEYEKEYGSE